MSATRTERTTLAAALLLTGALLQAAPASAADEDVRAQARSHFDHAVTLAKASDYRGALAEFQRAYELVPHYSTLYNIAQAQLALGQARDAKSTLERYLSDGGAAIEAQRRAEVEAQLRDLRAATGSPTQASPEPAATPAPAAAPPPEPAATPRASPPAQQSPPQPSATPAAPRRPKRSAPPAAVLPSNANAGRSRQPLEAEPPKHASSPGRTFAYVLGGASLALSGAALGHYFWNRERYGDWQAARADYERHPTDSERTRVNQLADSISRASVVTVALFVSATVTLGTGVVLFATGNPQVAPRRVGARDLFVGIRGEL